MYGKRALTKTFVCDFETTVYSGQVNTEVWAAACVELNTENVMIFHSIEEQLNYFKSLDCNIVAYYHNLKFDGSFWLSYLLIDKKYKQAIDVIDESTLKYKWKKNAQMESNSIKYGISDRGMW